MSLNETLLDLEKSLTSLDNLHASFDFLKLNIASPLRIKSWAERKLPTGEIVGEVLKPETINFRNYQPEINGLFCEKIFGPIKNWKCKCGKYNGFIANKICEECSVEIVEARVRRYRMGYINLIYPVVHIWYLKGIPSYLTSLLRTFDEKISITNLEQIIYLKDNEKQILSTINLNLFCHEDNSLENNFEFENKIFKNLKVNKTRKGNEILKAALENINLKSEIKKLRNSIDLLLLKKNLSTSSIDRNLIRRLRILESFSANKINPSWMILTKLPVLPPNLRPLIELENGRLAAADINEIYRLIITRNQRLFDFLFSFQAPEIIGIHARRLLQESVDSLIDNNRLAKEKIFYLNNKPLKSLTEILEGKQGRFRQSLLGKRVDYSGRSVIVVEPTLKLNQCGLPYEILIELFKPFIINQLVEIFHLDVQQNPKLVTVLIKNNKPLLWRILEKLTKKYSILLNRAPTLHRFGIQAFDPMITLNYSIQLHPLVCAGFNADFDGDQMAVHLPLYASSQLEIKKLMRPSNNILTPANGEIILKPAQDMVIGCYYLTLMISKIYSNTQKFFSSETEALAAFAQKIINLHTPILVRYNLKTIKFKIFKNQIEFNDSSFSFSFNNQKVLIKKIYSLSVSPIKYTILTNIGVFTVYKNNKNKYYLRNMFLETTIGRILFNTNFKNIIKA